MNKLIFLENVGSAHPDPCPDCGKRLILVVDERNVGRFQCEDAACDGNARCDASGRPIGFPIDKKGRKKRVDLHNLIDPFWRNEFLPEEANNIRQRMVYQFMNLYLSPPTEFHISNLTHDQLDKMLGVARDLLPAYARRIGLV